MANLRVRRPRAIACIFELTLSVHSALHSSSTRYLMGFIRADLRAGGREWGGEQHSSALKNSMDDPHFMLAKGCFVVVMISWHCWRLSRLFSGTQPDSVAMMHLYLSTNL